MTSVVVPVFNGAGVLPWSVPAVLALGAGETVWVDDGSTDETPAVLARLAGDSRTVRLPENRGRAAARNAGAAVAGGETLVFLDADVRPAPDLAARFERALAAPGRVATVARLAMADLGDDPYHDYLRSYPRGAPRAAPGAAVPWKHFVTTACAVSRDAFDAAGGFDERVAYGEDTALACALAALAPDGLAASGAAAEMTQAGTLDSALGKVAEFGRALPDLSRRCPDVYRLAGLERLAEPPAWARVAAQPLAARAVRAALPALPLGLRVRAVRYLLGQSLLHAHADAARSPDPSGRL